MNDSHSFDGFKGFETTQNKSRKTVFDKPTNCVLTKANLQISRKTTKILQIQTNELNVIVFKSPSVFVPYKFLTFLVICFQTVQQCDLKVMQSSRLEKLLRSLPWKWLGRLSENCFGRSWENKLRVLENVRTCAKLLPECLVDKEN